MWFRKCQIEGKFYFPQPAGHAFAVKVQYVVNLRHCTCTPITRTTRLLGQSFCLTGQSPACTHALSCPGPVTALTSVIAELHEISVSPFLCLAEVTLNGSPPICVFDCSPYFAVTPKFGKGGSSPAARVDGEDVEKYWSTDPSRL